jgi:hypothetical protein
MPSLSLESMRGYLCRSISSLNANKLNGLLAEIDFRNHLRGLGFADRVSPGGWIARREGAGEFGRHTVVMFPEILVPAIDYGATRELPQPTHGLHTICATFHQTGIAAFFCAATADRDDDPDSISWRAVQLGLPTQQEFQEFPECLTGFFRRRNKRYNFLRYKATCDGIPDNPLSEEFSKEHLRVSFQNELMSEMADVDGIFWGNQLTYPIEIKEKTVASDSKLGNYFGLDIGPFVKLAFYAAKRGNLHSIFVVKEIDSTETRNLVNWWFITYERLAACASWIQQGGGASMIGARSSVVKIPKAEFSALTRDALRNL